MKMMKKGMKIISFFMTITILLTMTQVFAATKTTTSTSNVTTYIAKNITIAKGGSTSTIRPKGGSTSTIRPKGGNTSTLRTASTNDTNTNGNNTNGKASGAAISIGTAVDKSNNVKTDSIAPVEASSQIQEKATPLLNAYIWFGYAIALGMVVFIGIKYMLGAADARANMKSAIVGWLIGAFIVFMATTIATIALKLATGSDADTNGLANQIVNTGRSLSD